MDGVSPQGFEAWLKTSHPHLKKGTAYRWMTAFKGLNLNESHKEADVDSALAALHKPTLASLSAAAIGAVAPPPPPALTLQQSEFGFLRDSLAAYRVQSEGILAIRDQLLEQPELHRAACARAYATLSALTGNDWAPSATPDPLALVNPDSIDI